MPVNIDASFSDTQLSQYPESFRAVGPDQVACLSTLPISAVWRSREPSVAVGETKTRIVRRRYARETKLLVSDIDALHTLLRLHSMT